MEKTEEDFKNLMYETCLQEILEMTDGIAIWIAQDIHTLVDHTLKSKYILEDNTP